MQLIHSVLIWNLVEVVYLQVKENKLYNNHLLIIWVIVVIHNYMHTYYSMVQLIQMYKEPYIVSIL